MWGNKSITHNKDSLKAVALRRLTIHYKYIVEAVLGQMYSLDEEGNEVTNENFSFDLMKSRTKEYVEKGAGNYEKVTLEFVNTEEGFNLIIKTEYEPIILNWTFEENKDN